ncbi:MAG TPA: hypothetical protein VFJ90_13710, partial [Candidatus Didemnitutus sp.]|nr:hypothetical protein [Candidatus Didemnitutus sp.]
MPTRRYRPKFTGLFHDETVQDSYWIRETGVLSLPPLTSVKQLAVTGELLPPDPADATSGGPLGLGLKYDS